MAHFSKRHGAGDNAPRDHYAEITAQIIVALEGGHATLATTLGRRQGGGPMMPHNAATGPRYRGINTIMLGMSPLAFISGDPRWATYKQAADRGWQVRNGRRGTLGIFYKNIEAETGPAQATMTTRSATSASRVYAFQRLPDRRYPFLRPANRRRSAGGSRNRPQSSLANSHAVIRIGGERAFFSPGTDHIQMPPAAPSPAPADGQVSSCMNLVTGPAPRRG